MTDNSEDTALALVGKTLAEGYRLEALIGQGAMGAVYRATAVTGAEVAVKTLSPQVMGDHSARFLRESELVRGLDHPHVVRTLDSGVDKLTGLMFLVMPLIKGRDLDRVLDELGALDPQTAVRIALQAARGLTAAHRIGIIHRDVKPGNLILDEEDGQVIVRVCDFGIAKQMGGSADSLTATGSQLGTPDYVSPEQLKSSKHVDERADIWSLGATLYQMLCGAAPYAHIESVFDLIAAIVTEDVPQLQARAPWLDTSLCLVVHKALQRDAKSAGPPWKIWRPRCAHFSGGDERLDPTRIRAVASGTRHLIAARADVPDAPKQTSAAQAAAVNPTIAGGNQRRAAGNAPAAGASKTAMIAVALLSATVAGGSAYLFVRSRAAAPAVAGPAVTATVQVVPASAQVSTPTGPIAVAGGVATLRGKPGETLRVTVQHGAGSKTFSVSLGNDGIATPSRLVLGP